MSEENKLVKIDDVINNKSTLIIDSYIPYAVKRVIVDNVKQVCLVKQDDGNIKLDAGLKMVTLEYSLIVQATNIDGSEESVITAYDKLKSNGIIQHVINAFYNDYDEILTILNEEIEQELKLSNSIEGVLRNALNKLVDKIPDEKAMSKMIKNLPKALDKVSPDTIAVLQGIMKGDIK